MSKIALFLLVLIGGCAVPMPQSTVNLSDAEPIEIFYGTDRDLRHEDKPSQFFGFERGVSQLGTIVVSGADEPSNTVMESVQPYSRELFLENISRAVIEAEEPTVLVFIHGFNRSFHQAGKLLAEFTVSTDFKGVPVMWSWPSARNPAAYLVDEANMRWSQPHLAQFLRGLLSHTGAATIHLIGHSMGGRSLVESTVFDLLPAGDNLTRIGEYVLLAPDIDAAIFKRDIAPALIAADLQVTLYTSSNDKAMASALTMRGGYPRAGDSSEGPVLVEGMETIDVTAGNSSILGHSYFKESEMINEDLADLLNNGHKAADRENLVSVEEEGGAYWRLVVGP